MFFFYRWALMVWRLETPVHSRGLSPSDMSLGSCRFHVGGMQFRIQALARLCGISRFYVVFEGRGFLF